MIKAFPKRHQRILLRFASLFERSQDEIKFLGDRRSVAAKFFIFVFLGVCIFAPLFTPAKTLISRWSNVAPPFPVQKADWKVSFLSEEVTCGNQVEPQCPAHPANWLLWESPFSRADQDHTKQIEAKRGHTFWVGTTLSGDRLKEAVKAGANHFILGKISGDFDIWLNGTHFLKGRSQDQQTPVILRIPESLMTQAQQMRLAVRILHNSPTSTPDLFSGAAREGFATYEVAENFFRNQTLINEAFPLVFFGLNLLVSLLFAAFWAANPRAQEYFYISSFAIIIAAQSILSFDQVSRGIPPNSLAVLWLSLSIYATFFGTLLALSFARATRLFFQWGLPLAVLSPIFSIPLWEDPAKVMGFLNFWIGAISPGLFLFGALVCGVQFLKLKWTRTRQNAIPFRIKRLLYFSYGMVALAIIYSLDSVESMMSIKQVFIFKTGHLVSTLYLASLLLLDYREQQKLIDRSLFSKYHRRAQLPHSVTGVLLQVELKNALKVSTEVGHEQYDTLITHWFTEMSSLLAKNGGEVIKESGDSLSAFFDNEVTEDPLHQAIQVLEQMSVRSESFKQDMGLKNGLYFRGGIAEGSIKPVWHRIHLARFASYEAVGESVFIEAARLMDLERELASKGETMVILKERTTQTYLSAHPEEADSFTKRNYTMETKDGTDMKVSAIVPRPKEKQKIKRAA